MLTIRDTRVFHGPSLWAPVPAIVLEVAIGELGDALRTQTPVFFERLTTLSLADFLWSCAPVLARVPAAGSGTVANQLAQSPIPVAAAIPWQASVGTARLRKSPMRWTSPSCAFPLLR